MAAKARIWLAYFIIGILILLIIPFWYLWVVPKFKMLSDHFVYTANILSLDNFYDKDIHQFEGEHISKTTFNYQVVEKKLGYDIIKNSFTVSKLSNIPIISVSRNYAIDPYTKQHVKVPLIQQRNGYLFAPEYAKKNDFIYWHVNYNAPALMKFSNVEYLKGLRVYHYQAHYLADQTENLGHLPNVPETQGIKTDIILQLWIEPISGWLVKYEDATKAFYYDRKTGKYLSPWNNFSNRYTEGSVSQQVHTATLLKWKFLLLDFVVPGVLFGMAMVAFVISFVKLKNPNYSLSIIHIYYQIPIYIIFMLVIFAIGITCYYLFNKKPNVYRIGISQWNNNIATIKGLKEGLKEKGYQEGKNIIYIIKNPAANIEKQIAVIQSFIAKHVNVIFTLSTPGTLIAKGITATDAIVFADVNYPEQVNIIDPDKPANLVGIKNYTSPAQSFYYFNQLYSRSKIIGFVHQRGDPDSEIQFQEYKNVLNRRDIQVIDIGAVGVNDLKQQLQNKNFDALFLACDNFAGKVSAKYTADWAKKNKIPTFSCDKNNVEQGILLGYVTDGYQVGKMAANKIAWILKGAETYWLHTDAPEKGFLIINLNTARVLGISVPEDILKQANQLIEK